MRNLISVFLALLILVAQSSRLCCGQCLERAEGRIIRGNSLGGLAASGNSASLLVGHYECEEPVRNELVAYRHPGRRTPIVKIIKAIPGDRFRLVETALGCQVLVNDAVLRNSKQQPYFLDRHAFKLLSLYEVDYKGIIPADSYLIMGDLSEGTLDSSRFGLVHRSDLLGKVILGRSERPTTGK